MVLNLQQLNNDHKTVEAEIKSKNALTEKESVTLRYIFPKWTAEGAVKSACRKYSATQRLR
jgi:uncharacterized protein YcbK (DUF882 family)